MKYALVMLCALRAWACVPIEGDHILGKDLAAAKPEFASMSASDASNEIGYAPRPGVTRVLAAEELLALARKFGIVTSGRMTSACFVRTLPVGGAIAPGVPQPPLSGPDVRRGEKVAVEVTSGAARIRLQADAESGGRIGELVLVRNPESGRLFQALVDGKGTVVVQK